MVLAIESLEERTVPSILFSSTGSRTIVDSSGPILSFMQVDLIFWGSGWNSGGGPALRTNVQNAVSNILNSTYFDALAQYRGIGHGSLLRADTITTTNPPANFTTAYGGDVSNFVANNINNNTLPSPNGRILYFIVPQPGSSPSDCGCLGRHLATIASNNRVAPYGLTEDPANVSLDTLTVIMSHEMAEAASDPEWNISIGSTNQSAFHASGAIGDEIGDGEAQNYTVRVNGALVQALDSQRDHAYIVTNGSTNNFLVSSARILTFQESGGGNNVIEINRVNNGVYATLNSSTAQFEPGAIHGIQVSALIGDQISIYRTGSDAPVTVNLGSGTEYVSVGTSLVDLGNIQGTITLNGGTGTDYLALIDTANSSNLTYTLTGSSLTRAGVTLVNFSGQSQLNLTLLGGRGADVYNVNGTENGSTNTITAGAGNAAVNVEATNGALTVNLTGSSNQVKVAPTSRNLDRINGAITVHGAGSDSLTLNDSNKAFISPGPPGAYFVTGTSIQRALTAAISYQSLSQVTLDTGIDVSGRILQVSVTGTAAGATTSVVALGGLNLIDVEDAGHTLNGLRGDLSVTGAGVTQLYVVDSGERFPAFQVGTYTVTGNSVQRAGTGAVRYAAVTTLSVSTGAYFNNPPLPILVTVTGTSAASTTVTAQPTMIPNQITVGDSARTLNGIRGALTVNGANFSQLTVDDHGTSTGGNSYTLANNSVTRMGNPAAVISYSGMITTTVNAANASNTLEVTGTAGSQALTLNTGSGGNTVNVQATSGGLLAVNCSTNDLINLASPAHRLDSIGNVTVNDPTGTTTVTADDSGDAGGGETYTVSSSALTVRRLATFQLTYNGIAGLTLNASTTGGNSINVRGTGANTALTVDTGPYDAVDLTSTANTLDPLGAVTVNDATGTSSVLVDDSGYGGSDTYTVTASTVTIGRSAAFNLTYYGIGSLTLNGGFGGETYLLDSTVVPTTVNGGAGANCFHVDDYGGNQYLAADILGPVTLNGSGADVLDFFDTYDPNSETFNFDAVPSMLTLGSNGVTIATFSGMGGGIYVLTNGFSTANDQSGTVIFDPSGGPPCLPGNGPLVGGGAVPASLVDRGAPAAASDPAGPFVGGAPAMPSALVGRPVPRPVDQADMLDQFFSLEKPSVLA
jgi:hypothetical protein